MKRNEIGFGGWLTGVLFLILTVAGGLRAQTTTFTYQGKLNDNGNPANSNYDMQFKLYDAAVNGSQIGVTAVVTNVHVVNGIFTVQLDFGNNFDGADRYLEIGIKPEASPNSYSVLTPRQPVTSAPYSIKSLTATTAQTADDSQKLGGVNANQYVLTGDARLADARNPLPDSPDYIQNTSTPQANSNFNVSGGGTVGGTLSGGVVNSATEFRINNSRVFSNAGTGNVFAGNAAGASNSGTNNSFFGNGAGFSNGSGSSNSFFGKNAGLLTDTGGNNSFFGESAGWLNGTGGNNTFLGYAAGLSNTVESNNTFVGANSNGTAGISFGTALGAGATVNSSNTVALGRNLDQVKIPGSFNVTGTSLFSSFTVSGNGIFNGRLGIGTNQPGGYFHVLGQNSSNLKIDDVTCFNGTTHFLGIGFGLPIANCAGWSLGGTSTGDTYINSDGANGTSFYFQGSNPLVVGQYVHAFVPVRLSFLANGGFTQLCLNIDNAVSSCSSSLRYKKDPTPFSSGLSVIKQLQPITFKWKANDRLDLGFGAEDIAAVEPLLVTYNADGQVEGVKYDRLSTLFVNAFKEQQAQIERQQQKIEEQERRLQSQSEQVEALKKLVCADRPQAEVCKNQP